MLPNKQLRTDNICCKHNISTARKHFLSGDAILVFIPLSRQLERTIEMKGAVAFYFIVIGITQVGGGYSLPWQEWAWSCVVGGVLLLLAVGMLRGVRVARIASIGVCTVVLTISVALAVISRRSGFLMIGVAFGIPLIGLLHPRCRRECNRTLRSMAEKTGRNATGKKKGQEPFSGLRQP